MSNPKVIVRYPPSPTGPFHMGTGRTLLFNYLFAKQNNGQIVFRLEDTDKERSKEEYAKDIIENLKWLGIEPDSLSPVRQSERTEIYKKYLEKLIAEGKAYVSNEEERDFLIYNPRKNIVKDFSSNRKEVIRFKNPNKKIVFNDLIRGDITFDTTELGDFVIAKSLLEPVYHLAVVVDDFEMGVTHILRGDDGISNTPRQILIQEAIGAQRPIYAHLPLMIDTDKTKLSKRKHGEKVSVSYYREMGYLPQAILNFLAMIGWNLGTDQEIFSLPELIAQFDITKVQKKSGVFNVEKLDWLNREYLLHDTLEAQEASLKAQVQKTKFKNSEKFDDPEFTKKFLKIILDRIHRWQEVSEMLEGGEYDYLFESPNLDKEKVLWKGESTEKAMGVLGKVKAIFELKTSYEVCREEIMALAEAEGKGDVLWPLRYALSGREKSPDPFTLLDILGAKESISRIDKAIEILTN